MKKILLLSLFTFCATIFYNCTETKEKTTSDTPKDTLQAVQFPNDDSELALLMRAMYEDSEVMKKAVEEGQLPADFRQKFKELHTATPTDSTTKGKAYNAMGDAFLANMNFVYDATDKTERIKAFNVMVQNCITCHQSHCPGPIKRIKKLTIR